MRPQLPPGAIVMMSSKSASEHRRQRRQAGAGDQQCEGEQNWRPRVEPSAPAGQNQGE
ncbi:hypothetical protein [Lentzea xinjiangensis]|uniref:hypothetical protein n=1 Tax=Lentzea xinjiangensis TaxID=402600 RepID=UPI0015A668CD|nr:hypothetical protein [Lentzea xinjiangensis]